MRTGLVIDETSRCNNRGVGWDGREAEPQILLVFVECTTDRNILGL